MLMYVPNVVDITRQISIWWRLMPTIIHYREPLFSDGRIKGHCNHDKDIDEHRRTSDSTTIVTKFAHGHGRATRPAECHTTTVPALDGNTWSKLMGDLKKSDKELQPGWRIVYHPIEAPLSTKIEKNNKEGNRNEYGNKERDWGDWTYWTRRDYSSSHPPPSINIMG